MREITAADGWRVCRIVRNKAAEKAKQSMPSQHHHHHHHHHSQSQQHQQQASQTPCSLSPSPTSALISSAATPAAGYTIGSILGIPIPSLAALPLPPSGPPAISPSGAGTERLPACSGSAVSAKRPARDDDNGNHHIQSISQSISHNCPSRKVTSVLNPLAI